MLVKTWETDIPPIGMNENVFVACGNGEVALMKANELNEKNRNLCWVAWQSC